MSSFLNDPTFAQAIEHIENLGESPSGPFVDGRTLAGLLRSGFSTPISTAAGLIKHNFTATSIPTNTDDTTEGYSVGSIWIRISQSQAFICTKSDENLAEWDIISPGQETVLLIKGFGFGGTDTIPYENLAAAAAAAVGQDMIVLSPGFHFGPLSLPDAVRLQGAGPANGGSFLVSFTSAPILTTLGNSIISDISLLYGGAPGSGPTNLFEIGGSSAGVTLDNVLISPNVPGKNGIGAAAGVTNIGSVVLRNCDISGQASATGSAGIKIDKPGSFFVYNCRFFAQTDIKLIDLSGGCIMRASGLTNNSSGTGPASAKFIVCADATCFIDDMQPLGLDSVFELTSASSKVNVSSSYLDDTLTKHLTAPVAGAFFQFLGGQLNLTRITHDPGAKVLIAGGNIEAGKEGEVTYASSGLVGNMSEFIVDGTVVLSVDKSGNVSYTPATPAHWTGSPSNTKDAIDRIAAHVFASHGAIP